MSQHTADPKAAALEAARSTYQTMLATGEKELLPALCKHMHAAHIDWEALDSGAFPDGAKIQHALAEALDMTRAQLRLDANVYFLKEQHAARASNTGSKYAHLWVDVIQEAEKAAEQNRSLHSR